MRVGPVVLLHGVQSNCLHGSPFGNGTVDGGQGEYVRTPYAGATLVKVPGKDFSDEQLASFTALTDVMCTGYHAAVSAGVKAGDTVAVVGDGAVGLSAVLAARKLGAERIIALSRNSSRQVLAKEFGATDIVEVRGSDAIDEVLRLTDGVGVDAALECVGTDQAIETAVAAARIGAASAQSVFRCTTISSTRPPFGRTSACAGAWLRPGNTFLSFSTMCSPAASTRAGSSISRPIWTTWAMRTRSWTSAGPSSHCCG